MTARHRSRWENKAAREVYEWEQQGVCAICDQPPTDGEVLHLDHDHVTGDNRGLLCRSCNLALGLLQDDIDRLIAAIDYLQRPQRKVSRITLRELRLQERQETA